MSRKTDAQRYCIEVLGMTLEQAKERLMRDWEKKLRANAREYYKTKKELSNDK